MTYYIMGKNIIQKKRLKNMSEKYTKRGELAKKFGIMLAKTQYWASVGSYKKEEILKQYEENFTQISELVGDAITPDKLRHECRRYQGEDLDSVRRKVWKVFYQEKNNGDE